jgi:hypothetical protein
VIVRLDRRALVWISVTTNPTAEWVARQITEAFPWDMAPRYMIRDRDRIYGIVVTRRLRAMGIRDKPIAPASPWQNGFAERLIGSLRRECLDHVIVLGEAHLRRILKNYAAYYRQVSEAVSGLSQVADGLLNQIETFNLGPAPRLEVKSVRSTVFQNPSAYVMDIAHSIALIAAPFLYACGVAQVIQGILRHQKNGQLGLPDGNSSRITSLKVAE